MKKTLSSIIYDGALVIELDAVQIFSVCRAGQHEQVKFSYDKQFGVLRVFCDDCTVFDVEYEPKI